MIEGTPQMMTRFWAIGKPVPVFALVSGVMLVSVGLLSYGVSGSVLAAISVFAVVIALCLRGLLNGYPHDVFGACNAVTLGRAGLVAVLAGAISIPVSTWAIFGVSVIAFALDGVDGWLARRTGLTSAFGARFDMEVDTLLGAVLAVILLLTAEVGPAILVLGFSRYVFVLTGLKWSALQGDLPESYRRKAICVLQIGALIILIFPLTPVAMMLPISLFAATALLYSFAADALYLLRNTP
ncbi:MAG: CDP-alcohol phosphatidyltransferase family protein [Aliishimia sp.]